MNILFLCTGNTCRSPMAAALFSRMAHVDTESAGLYAAEGQPAAAHMLALAEEYHVNINGHRSRLVSFEMLEQAEFIVCLSAAHAMRVKDHAAHEKIRVLGGGIADPFGGSLEEYRACAEEMNAAMPSLRKDIFCPCRMVPAREEHLPAFVALQRAVFCPPASEERLRERLEAPRAHTLTALLGDEVAGYISVDEISGEAFVDDVAVFPKYQRRGVGSALLARAEAGAILRGCEKIHLEAREHSPARALYAARGYREVGRRKDMYESPIEDGILMTLFVS